MVAGPFNKVFYSNDATSKVTDVSDNELDISEDDDHDENGDSGLLTKPQYEVKVTSKEEKDYWLLRLTSVLRQLTRTLKLNSDRMPKLVSPFPNPTRKVAKLFQTDCRLSLIHHSFYAHPYLFFNQF